MSGTVTQGFLSKLETRRDQVRHACEGIALEARAAGQDHLNEGQARRFAQAKRDLEGLDEHIAEIREDLQRIGNLPKLGRENRAVGSAARLAPLAFGPDEMRRMQSAAQRGDPCRIELRAFSTADSLIPATLWPYPVEQVHEQRLLDKLPGIAFDTPAITFIRHVSTTGVAAPTSEGSLKPELVFNTDALTAWSRSQETSACPTRSSTISRRSSSTRAPNSTKTSSTPRIF